MAGQTRRQTQRDPAEHEIPRHEGPCTRDSRHGPAGGHLLHAVDRDLCRAYRQLLGQPRRRQRVDQKRPAQRALPLSERGRQLLEGPDRSLAPRPLLLRGGRREAMGRMGYRLPQVRLESARLLPRQGDARRPSDARSRRRLQPLEQRTLRRRPAVDAVLQLLAHDGRHPRHVGEHQQHRVQPGPLAALQPPGPLGRPRHAGHRHGGLGPETPLHAAHGRRAVYAHQPLVAAGRAAADRLRHGADGRLHTEPADQRRSDRRQPGPAGPAGRPRLAAGRPGDLRQAPRRRLDGRRAFQPGLADREDELHAPHAGSARQADRARPVAAEGPHGVHRQVRNGRCASRRRSGESLPRQQPRTSDRQIAQPVS